jgi:hypothetical protein
LTMPAVLLAVSLAGCTERSAPLDANAGEDQVVAPEEFLTPGR